MTSLRGKSYRLRKVEKYGKVGENTYDITAHAHWMMRN